MDTLITAGVRSEVSGQRPAEPDVRRLAGTLREMAAAVRDGRRPPAGRCTSARTFTRWPRPSPACGARWPASKPPEDRPVPMDWRTRARDGLVVLLTVTTGAVDAACFMHLGHVFCSVVTGTLVLLGVAAGTHDGSLAESCGVALANYTAGVAVAAPFAARRTGRWLPGWPGRRAQRPAAHREIWPSWLTVALALEFGVLAVFCAGWELARGQPTGGQQLLLLIPVGVAMGIQGATVRQLGEISTTYLTGTLTGVVAALAIGRIPDGLDRSLGIFAAVVLGAVGSAVITTYVPGLLPLLVLTPLALVVWIASARFGPRPASTR